MSIETKTFVRNPFIVQAVEVTAENMEEVAEWCKGKVKTVKKLDGGTPERHIKVKVHRPLNQRQTMAFIGDRVLYAPSNKGFKVYTPNAFKRAFVEHNNI